jgi:eukaryotic-like serine/threonine-protein kinase
MESDRWRAVEQLYHQALEHPEGERGAFVRNACAGDDALRQAVESLLSVHQGAATFLETPAAELAARALAETAPASEGEADLFERLRTALADRYEIERELAHGGMARVYLAQDRKHQRHVAIKVLRPEVAASIGAARFLREITIAAQLNHPHILPLHDSGEADGFLYYVMPYVPGESLRSRLERERQLRSDDALQIAREVADALAHAHSMGIVHRDIKPENILFAAGHAVVSDFGIARAISVAEGESVTDAGVAIGTPAYMSPEQATGSELLDSRSDIYSLGCVLYEMLAGEPPFTGASAQAVLAAQVTATPKPLGQLRRGTQPAVLETVARALAKDPAARFQAAEFRDAIAPLAAAAAGRRGHPLRVAGLYGLAAVAVLGVVYALTMQLGLPGWVTAGAALLLFGGLPIMVATGIVERGRAVARAAGGVAPLAGGLAPWLTWRRALAGGGVTFGVLGVGTTAYMAMRLLGLGPLGTLVAAGVLKNREPLILADFDNRTADSTLGPSLTAAFRVDLGESPVVRLLDPTAIADALRRAERPATTPLNAPLARELAQREHVKAVVRGEIDPLGGGYVLAASIVAAADGQVLTAVRETAASDAGLIGAVDRLSRKLRERIGESLKSIRAGPPLEQVTTGSLDALRKYSEAVRARAAGDFERALAGYRDAIAIDTAFAMAYSRLAETLEDAGASSDSMIAAVAEAFALRERLPDVERYLVSGLYYNYHDHPRTRVIAAYRSVLERDPDNTVALDNLAEQLIVLRRFRDAESLAVRATALGTVHSTLYALTAQVGEGHFADAETTLVRYGRAAPHNPRGLLYRSLLASAQMEYPRAEQAARAARDDGRSNLTLRSFGDFYLAAEEAVEGKLARAEQDLGELMALNEAQGQLWWYFLGAVDLAEIELRLRNHHAGGLRAIEAALRRHPLATASPLDRPYVGLSRFFVRAGRLDEAARLLAEYARTIPEGLRGGNAERLGAEGDLLLARGRISDAITRYQAWYDDTGWCCFRAAQAGLFEIATAYDQARSPDSALTYYERIVATPSLDRLYGDQLVLGPTLRRLGELYEARGDRAKAREYFGRFLDLWKDADPELQGSVTEARTALKRLSAESR